MSKGMTVTVEEIWSWNPCDKHGRHSLENLRKLAGGRVDLDAEYILGQDHIPAAHRIWCALHRKLIIEPILWEFACRVAEGALEVAGNPDPRSVAAIAARRAWMRGEIGDTKLREAARSAADAAARSADAAARSAAAAAAADAAAADAAAAAERNRQVAILLELLREVPSE